MHRTTALSPSAQSAYAQLLDAAVALEHSRSVADLPGTFVRKVIKGKDYWYYQAVTLHGIKRQVYLGPEDDRIRHLIATKASLHDKAQRLAGLSAAAVALGNSSMAPKHLAATKRLAAHGIFSEGGILVGTHAFLIAGNMLGIRWQSERYSREVDFTNPGATLGVALQIGRNVRVGDAVTALDQGILPVTLSGRLAQATDVSPSRTEPRIVFLTPTGRADDDSTASSCFGTAATRSRFLAYLLEGSQPAVMIGSKSAVLVNIPDPARFAAHKILLAGKSPHLETVKANADVLQAAALIEVLSDVAPHSLQEAFADLLRRGRAWTLPFQKGRQQVCSVLGRRSLECWPA